MFLIKAIKRPEILLFVVSMFIAFYIGRYTYPIWTVEKVSLDVETDQEGRLYFTQEDKKIYIRELNFIPIDESRLSASFLKDYNETGKTPPVQKEYVYEVGKVGDTLETFYYMLKAQRHWKMWSLLPAAVALSLCWITKEPISSLLGGIFTGAFLLGKYNITQAVFVPELSTESAAAIIVLYLWLLGGLMGIWSRTGAAVAFAEFMTKNFVHGRISAKLVAWFLGVIFFQGGTVSSVLVGTTVKPISDKNKVSHEELSYIVDSTSSPIAALLAFNAWPGYIQGFIYVAGVPWLASEAKRISFFFQSIPFAFYSILAVTATFLLSIEKTPFVGKQLKNAIHRVKTTGKLDAPGAKPLSAKELQVTHIPHNYQPSMWEFIIPLLLLIGISTATFFIYGVPEVHWAFGIALVVAFTVAIFKGMSMKTAVDGVADGLKGVVVGSVVLLLAIIIGSISKQTGGGIYLVESLKESIPYWLLPLLLQIMTIIASFSTGTSWGTYALAFPLAMPLSWAVATSQGIADPEFYMLICFAAVMNGSIYGDQCSPISDTTVLSAMCTGCDLIDHVKTQIPQATVAAIISGFLWTLTVLLFV